MVLLAVLAGAGAGVEGVNGMDGAGDPSEAGIGSLLAIVCSIYNKVFLLYLSISRTWLMPVYAVPVKLGIYFRLMIWYNAYHKPHHHRLSRKGVL